MSVHNEYTGYTLKHLLLRHMYNLPLPVLMCYAFKPYALRLLTATATLLLLCSVLPLCCSRTVLCGALYTACVDASRTVFWNRSQSFNFGTNISVTNEDNTNSKGDTSLLFNKFPQNSMKMKKKLGRGGDVRPKLSM